MHCSDQQLYAWFLALVEHVLSLSVLLPQLHFSPVIGSHISPWPLHSQGQQGLAVLAARRKYPGTHVSHRSPSV
uniref:Putative secreted protein n=1 Tax=Anopheles marajoara TaxID=58244 RepID=A0A2M4CDC2_9DIPT